MAHFFLGGPHDGAETKHTRKAVFMPMPGTEHVAFYRRRWQDESYDFQGIQHENTVLGAHLLPETLEMLNRR